MKKEKVVIAYLATALTLTACGSDDAVGEASYIGKPIDISITLDDMAQTRTEAPMTTGSAYLKSNIAGAVWKRYTWDSQTSKFTSENQLMWTASTMVITGYYINNGASRPADDLSYTVSSSNQTYLVGQTTATWGSTSSLSITLKQQLAKIVITIASNDGSTLKNPRLGGGLLHATGSFDNSAFANGYATGGDKLNASDSEGTGWTVLTTESTTTLDMTAVSGDGTSSATYYAIIMPQVITNTAVDFFTIDTTNGDINHSTGYRLTSGIAFKAGKTYNLVVDNVTNTLYLESTITIADFNDADSGDKIDNTTASHS